MRHIPHSAAGSYVLVNDQSGQTRTSSYDTSRGVFVGQASRGPVGVPTLITSQAEFLNTFGAPVPGISFAHYGALNWLEHASPILFTRVVSSDALTAGLYLMLDDVTADIQKLGLYPFPDSNGDPVGIWNPIDTLGFDFSLKGIETIVGFVCAANPGEWNNSISIRVSPVYVEGTKEFADTSMFNLDVLLSKSPLATPIESWTVSLDNRLNTNGRQTNVEHVVNGNSKYIRFKTNPFVSPDVKFTRTAQSTFSEGSGGSVPSDASIVQAWLDHKTLEDRAQSVLFNCGYTSSVVHAAISEVATTRKDCIAILDMPREITDLTAMIAYKRSLGIDSEFAGLFAPYVQIEDPYLKHPIWIPPSCVAAGVYANTDANYGLWYGASGTDRGQLDISDVAIKFDQGFRNALTNQRINYIRFVADFGYCLWGVDSLDASGSSLATFPARRVVSYIEKELQRILEKAVFDPATYSLLDTITDSCERVLSQVKRDRGLIWYEIVCDKSNNPSAALQQGDIVVKLGLEPVATAKRMVIGVTITRHKEIRFTEYAN